jgi:hypothetical protein
MWIDDLSKGVVRLDEPHTPVLTPDIESVPADGEYPMATSRNEFESKQRSARHREVL